MPPKINNLLWRCMRHILLVREVLKTKGVWIGGGCPLCNFEVKNIPHILCECPIACQLLGCDDVLHESSFVDFVKTILRDLDMKVGITMVARFWVMWMVCNDVVWNEIKCSGRFMKCVVMWTCCLLHGRKRGCLVPVLVNYK